MTLALPAGDDDENNRQCRFCGRRFVPRHGSGRRGRKAGRFFRCVRTQPAVRQPGQRGGLSDGSPGANWRQGIFIAADIRHPEYQRFRTSCWACEACVGSPTSDSSSSNIARSSGSSQRRGTRRAAATTEPMLRIAAAIRWWGERARPTRKIGCARSWSVRGAREGRFCLF